MTCFDDDEKRTRETKTKGLLVKLVDGQLSSAIISWKSGNETLPVGMLPLTRYPHRHSASCTVESSRIYSSPPDPIIVSLLHAFGVLRPLHRCRRGRLLLLLLFGRDVIR